MSKPTELNSIFYFVLMCFYFGTWIKHIFFKPWIFAYSVSVKHDAYFSGWEVGRADNLLSASLCQVLTHNIGFSTTQGCIAFIEHLHKLRSRAVAQSSKVTCREFLIPLQHFALLKVNRMGIHSTEEMHTIMSKNWIYFFIGYSCSIIVC